MSIEVEKKFSENQMYRYTIRSKHRVIDYNFWRAPESGWKVLKTIYDVEDGDKTTEIFIPDEVLDKMITEKAKEELSG